jgi:AcrR family transcriptional regulator
MSLTSGRPGLRERQRQETHELIWRMAYELTVEKGAAAVSVQNICDAAGVSSRTFFNHFPSKDEALIPDFPAFPEEARQAFVQRVEPDLVTALEQLLSEYIVWLHQQTLHPVGPDAMKLLLERNPELLPRVLIVFEAHERRIAELVSHRTGRPSVDLFCIVASLTATATMRAAFSLWHDPATGDPCPADPQDSSKMADALKSLIPEAFSILRHLATPDVSAGSDVPESSSSPS